MWNIAPFHTLDLRMRGPLLEHAPELLECLRCSGGDHFHGAVAQIAYEPAQSPPLRLTQHEPAEPHSLHPAVHEEPQGDHSRSLTPAAPATRAAGTTRRTLPRRAPGSALRPAPPVLYSAVLPGRAPRGSRLPGSRRTS